MEFLSAYEEFNAAFKKYTRLKPTHFEIMRMVKSGMIKRCPIITDRELDICVIVFYKKNKTLTIALDEIDKEVLTLDIRRPINELNKLPDNVFDAMTSVLNWDKL